MSVALSRIFLDTNVYIIGAADRSATKVSY